MCGSLCDYMLERSGSAVELEMLEASNLFVVPLDRERKWYRLHRLFRDMLRDELDRREPALAASLNGRAADWCVANGDLEGAIDYAHAAGDTSRVIELVGAAAQPAYHSGRFVTVERWLARLEDEEELAQSTGLATLGAWTHALRGRPEAARRWAQIAESGAADAAMPDGAPPLAWTLTLRAAMCSDGVERMQHDAEAAIESAVSGSHVAADASFMLAIAHFLAGDDDLADRLLAETCALALEVGATDSATLALAQRSLLASARNEGAEAELLALQARELVTEARLGDYATSALTYVASARAALRHSNWTRALEDIDHASRLAPLLTYALPWLAVQVRLELARAHLALVNWAPAVEVMAEIDELLARRPDVGVLTTQAHELQLQLAQGQRQEDNWASSLTGAELRLLPLLTTHFSFREIAERLFVSRNTVKTQAISVYRKLGVSSRSEAIERAAELGLVTTPPDGASSQPLGEQA